MVDVRMKNSIKECFVVEVGLGMVWFNDSGQGFWGRAILLFSCFPNYSRKTKVIPINKLNRIMK